MSCARKIVVLVFFVHACCALPTGYSDTDVPPTEDYDAVDTAIETDGPVIDPIYTGPVIDPDYTGIDGPVIDPDYTEIEPLHPETDGPVIDPVTDGPVIDPVNTDGPVIDPVFTDGPVIDPDYTGIDGPEIDPDYTGTDGSVIEPDYTETGVSVPIDSDLPRPNPLDPLPPMPPIHIDSLNLTVPGLDLKGLNLTLPDININIPEIKLPQIELPQMELPEFPQLPELPKLPMIDPGELGKYFMSIQDCWESTLTCLAPVLKNKHAKYGTIELLQQPIFDQDQFCRELQSVEVWQIVTCLNTIQCDFDELKELKETISHINSTLLYTCTDECKNIQMKWMNLGECVPNILMAPVKDTSSMSLCDKIGHAAKRCFEEATGCCPLFSAQDLPIPMGMSGSILGQCNLQLSEFGDLCRPEGIRVAMKGQKPDGNSEQQTQEQTQVNQEIGTRNPEAYVSAASAVVSSVMCVLCAAAAILYQY